MGHSIHIIDLGWALLALLAGAYPVWRLSSHLRRQTSRDFCVLVVLLASYPLLLAMFHLTPFDLGLVYALTLYIAPMYCLAMVRYLHIQLPYPQQVRTIIFAITGGLALLALTNRWHGWFAQFEPHVAGRANHLLDDLMPGIGMGLMHALTLVMVAGIAILAIVQFARSRFHPVRFALAVLLPLLGLWSFTATARFELLAQQQVSGFMLTTTLALLLSNYALARDQFLEDRVVTRSRIMALMPDSMAVLSRSGRIVDCNPAFAQLCGSAAGTVVGSHLVEQLPSLAEGVDGSEDAFEISLGASVAQRTFYVTLSQLDSKGGQRLLLLRDMTEQAQTRQALQDNQRQLKMANETLQRLSTTDSLTGLRNRRYLSDQLDAQMALAARTGLGLGVLALDLDHFKAINDQYGHQAGDRVLCHAARVLENQCRGTDILARVGGEEFVVLMLDADPAGVEAAAKRMVRAVATNCDVQIDGATLAVTVSVGAAMLDAGDSPSELLHRADEALYVAKQAGRNQAVLA